jgi:3-phenylpropionate/trans-cinnamate dioxygenase ferredoxin subunit
MSFVPVCRLDELPSGRARRFVVEGTAVAVVRTEEGVFAIADRCSHADVALSEGEVEGCSIECWLHGSAFDLRTGQALTPPAALPVATFAVRVDSDAPDAAVEVDPTPIDRTIARDSAERTS